MEEQRRLVREDAPREAVLRHEEGVLPRPGKRVEAAVDLDELGPLDGLRQAAPGDARGRRLGGGYVTVAGLRYFEKPARLALLSCTSALNILHHSACEYNADDAS